MRIIEDIAEMRRHVSAVRHEGKSLGFVPTMGALHGGHLSLMEHAKKQTDHLVSSIFVNPAQFGPREDFREYPRDPKGDTEMALMAGVHTLFTPFAGAIYPDDYKTFVEVEGMSDILCGKTRPGHFRGVATIVLILFNIIRPDKAFFGQKDFQQVVIIKKMTRDLRLGIDIEMLPTIREDDGLALSSRNRYLSREERLSAPVLYRSLQDAHSIFEKGETSSEKLRDAVLKTIQSEEGVRIEYVAIIDPETLAEKKEAGRGTVIALAARIGKTRLIDNIVL